MAKVFRFCDLPLELRDHIREYLYKDVKTIFVREELLRVRIPLPQIRLVSHRMKQEYDRRPPFCQTWASWLPSRLPRCAAKSTTFNLDIYMTPHDLFPCAAVSNEAFASEFTRVLYQLPYLERTTLKINLASGARRTRRFQLLVQDIIGYASIDLMSEISVTTSTVDPSDGQSGWVLLARWTATDGLLLYHERIEAMQERDRIQQKSNQEKAELEWA